MKIEEIIKEIEQSLDRKKSLPQSPARDKRITDTERLLAGAKEFQMTRRPTSKNILQFLDVYRDMIDRDQY